MISGIVGSTRTKVVALAALLAILCGGTAYAAKHYLITSIKQIKPSVRRELRDTPGQAGATGQTGATGTTGATAAELTVLPSGETETGSYDAEGTATAVGDLASASISFSIPLASAPSPNLISSSSTSACPGSVTKPTAAPGQLCVYEGTGGSNVGEIGAYNPINGDPGAASQYGAGIVVDSAGLGNFYSEGTWAVTAP
jgi:hypothetical protein